MQTFGFQESNVQNQKEHVLLLLTNFKEQSEEDTPPNGENAGHGRDPQKEMELAKAGIARLHSRLFANYIKWAKYVSASPAFTSDPLVDIVLFFLVWGEAGNFRQVPELLCFLLHNMLPQATSRSGGDKAPGDFLNEVIRPLYTEVKKDNDKKTVKGARAAHYEIRNYDDFNEFFWNKKCLKYNITTISEAFADVDKKGAPSTVKKTFIEKRSWVRALLSFRRIFLFNLALFFACVGFGLNVVMVCPDTPILYGPDVSNGPSRSFTVLGKNFTIDDLIGKVDYDPSDDGKGNGFNNEEDSKDAQCIVPMLASCLGIDYDGHQFDTIPLDFKAVLQVVPFTSCIQQTSGRCGCYITTLEKCFKEKGTTETRGDDGVGPVKSLKYDQSKCIPKWKDALMDIIKKAGPGRLNCEVCQLDLKSLIKNGKVGDLIAGLLAVGDGKPIILPTSGEGDDRTVDVSDVPTKRQDTGALGMFLGGACVALVLVCELVNKVTSGMASGYVGRSMPVPMKAWINYSCFWIFLLFVKLTFDYQFMVKGLVETSLFIWYAREDDYLKYSNFMMQITFHNIAYILFLLNLRGIDLNDKRSTRKERNSPIRKLKPANDPKITDKRE